MTAKLLGKDMADLKFIASEIGGGFGGKTVVYLEPVAALLSEKAGRPVKMQMSREEVFRATGPTSGTVTRVKVGLKMMALSPLHKLGQPLRRGLLPERHICRVLCLFLHPIKLKTSW